MFTKKEKSSSLTPNTKYKYMKIGVIQINSINDLEVNKEKINFLIRSAVLDGAKAVFLPEVAFFRGAS
ncbi:MAG: hypothetical protein COS94_08710, partial [Candidatus Hydrogenedentes bacterium CG07_land_8_20_14_0_80_42_17]